MTSANFAMFPVGQINVDRATRQRKELKGIPELADSINRNGLINPIVITRAGELVAGERRFEAVKSLNWSVVPVQFQEDLDPISLHLIELEENIKRENITWQEECAALAKYHDVKKAENAKWADADTARSLGLSRPSVSEKLAVAKEMVRNDKVAGAEKFSQARTITEKIRNRARTADMDNVEAIATRTGLPAPTPAPIIPLLNTAFTSEWIAEYEGPKFNFLHCDFPYGVNAGEHDQGAAGVFDGYEDSFDTYTNLLDTLEMATEMIVMPDAQMMFWFSMDHYTFTFERLESMGWFVSPFPLIWHKSDNTGIMPDARRQPRRVYETAFICHRGDRFIIDAVSNVCAHPNVKEVHMSEKPRGMLKHFFRMFIDSTTNMLDPTCGSGNSVWQAEKMGANIALGLEMNPEFHARAVAAYKGETE